MADHVDPNTIEDVPTPGDGDPEREDEGDSALDRMRDMPTGTNDPNIVGDVGPTDIPPGADPA